MLSLTIHVRVSGVPGVFNKTIIILGLAGYEIIITNLVRANCHKRDIGSRKLISFW